MLTEGLGHELGSLHAVEGISQRLGQPGHAGGRTLRSGEGMDVVLNLGREFVSIADPGHSCRQYC